MAAVSETIVREFFELNGFLVRQERKFIPRGKDEDDGIDFFVSNPHPRAAEAPLPFVLGSNDVAAIARGIVAVRGWHTESYSQSVLENAPELVRFAEPSVYAEAVRALGAEPPPLKILIVPSLPATAQLREQSLGWLKSKGIDAVIPFRTLLIELVARVEVNRNYEKSDLLQTIRVLKNYELIREPQLELFKQRRKAKAKG